MTDSAEAMPTVAQDIDGVIERLAHEILTDERMETMHAFDHCRSAREWLRRRDGA